MLHSSATVSQNLLRFHGATSHALDLTPLAASCVFCLLISDPRDAVRNSESYLEIRGSLKCVPKGKRIYEILCLYFSSVKKFSVQAPSPKKHTAMNTNFSLPSALLFLSLCLLYLHLCSLLLTQVSCLSCKLFIS